MKKNKERLEEVRGGEGDWGDRQKGRGMKGEGKGRREEIRKRNKIFSLSKE